MALAELDFSQSASKFHSNGTHEPRNKILIDSAKDKIEILRLNEIHLQNC